MRMRVLHSVTKSIYFSHPTRALSSVMRNVVVQETTGAALAIRYQRETSAPCARTSGTWAGPRALWNDALVTPCAGPSRRRLRHLRLRANTAMLQTACLLWVIGHQALLGSLGQASPGGHPCWRV